MLGPGESILKDSTQDFATAGDSGRDVVLVMVVVVEVIVVGLLVMAVVVAVVDCDTFCICSLDFNKLFQ